VSVSSRSLIHNHFTPLLSISSDIPAVVCAVALLATFFFEGEILLSLSFFFRHKLTLCLFLAWIVLIIYKVHLALKSQGSHLPSSMECGLPLRIVLFGAYVAIGMWLVSVQFTRS